MKTLRLLFLLLFGIQAAQATHIAGGYIQATQTNSALTYQVTVQLYFNEVSGTAAAEAASSLSVCFGDGQTAEAFRASRRFVNGKLSSINTYTIVHTYAGPGTYTLSSAIPNRTGVLNIPNAANQTFTLTTTFTTSTGGINTTPTPNPQILTLHAGVRQQLTLPFDATDADGDSLEYLLAIPQTTASQNLCGHQAVVGYRFPNNVTQQGTYKLNNRTGILIWDNPVQVGTYSLAILINEYRKGINISQTQHEIVLTVDDQPGTPAPLPPYEPASYVGDVVTAVIPYLDADVQIATFPNPVDDRLQVVIQTSTPATAQLALTDANGRTLHQMAFAKAARQHEQVISMASLTPGVYFLRTDVNGRQNLRKVVKR